MAGLMKGVAAGRLSQLLEPTTAEEFLATSWGKTYRHIRGWPGKFARLLPWEMLNDILRQHRLDFPRLRLVLDGRSLPVSAYLRHTVAAGRRRQPIPRLQPVKLTAELRRGATLVLDAVDELSQPLEDLAAALELIFREHVQINTYAGWHTSRGFDLHWDDHDVFVLQVTGRKRWSVYGMTRSHPHAGDDEPAPKPTTPPLWEETLEDGDLLYIPRGWWHVAVPLDEPTLHLTVGIHNRTGLDLLRWVGERLRARETFRRDLPRFLSGEERAAHLRRLREELLEECRDDLFERYFEDLDRRAESRARLSLPWGAGGSSALPEGDAAALLVRLLAPRPLNFRTEGGAVEFDCLGRRWRLAASAAPLLGLLEERRVCSVAELCEAAGATLNEQTVRVFLGELLTEGLIAVVRETF
jgi:hypothetical protein